jgi:hypothetical protein
MKRSLLFLTAFITLSIPVLTVSGNALAVDVFQPCSSAAAGTDVCNDASSQQGNNTQGSTNPIIKIIKAAIEVLSFIIGVAAIIGIVVSGIRLMTSGGDSNAVASARSGLVYSLIGIAVVALAQVLVAFVLDNVK